MKYKMKKLEKLLYRKNSIEKTMPIHAQQLKVLSKLITELKKDKKNLKKQIEVYDLEKQLNDVIVTLKLEQREYNHYLLPQIEEEKTSQDNINFDSLKKITKQIHKNQFFNNFDVLPANVEIVEINNSLAEHIKILEKLEKQLAEFKSGDTLEMARVEKELFDTNLNLLGNKIRLEKRIEYYNNQFLPKYKKELKEAKKYLGEYLAKAKEISTLNIDHKLTFLLSEYDKHKKEDEKLWLFYTALKQRVDSILVELKENTMLGKTKDKKMTKLLSPVI
jgi:uncharacterized protein YqfB (UPF0267 family)